MNILFLNTGIPNYVPDAVYIGSKRLGHTVEDRPRKPSLHSSTATYRYGTEVCGDFGTSVVDNPDLIFVEARYTGLLPESFIVVDGKDDSLMVDRLYQSAFLYFKREYTKEWKRFSKARPFPCGAVRRQDSFGIPCSKREIDISFTLAFHQQTPIREKVFDFLENMKGFKAVMGFKPFSEYQKILDASKISISLRGCGGWDSYRYWEIVHHGAVLCSEQLHFEIPNNFSEDEAIFFDSGNPADLEEKLRYYLSNIDRLDRMQAKAWEKFVKFHTAKARAKYVLQEVEKYYETL
ncbi:glycosyltransferase family 1 protein [bacterium]|nr:glycosyltransferase family 1 protein [bacterium]